jgi:predicted NBD/HSP70 family sugar kinase
VIKQVNGKTERDRHVVEAIVRRFGPISRARIHELSQIRLSATSTLVRSLLQEGRLVECGVEESTVGRKSVLLQLNESYGSVVGIEFDDESLTVGVSDLYPRMRHLITEHVQLDGGQEKLIRQLLSVTRRVLQEARIRKGNIVGIGVADPGLVDRQHGVTLTSSTIPFWRRVPLREIFEREFGVPVLIETCTRAKAVAEHEAEGGDHARSSMIYVDYGSGIGAGLYVDGRLLYGQGSAAGEFGHTCLAPDGPVCTCGSFGCLEAMVGLRAVEARVRRLLLQGASSSVLDAAGGNPEAVTGWMVFGAASGGDKVASNVVAEVAQYLGLGIANLVNLFNPGLVVLDARLQLAGPELVEGIASVVRRQALREATEQVVIRYASVTEAAGALGVARLVLERHFAIPAFRMPPFLMEEGL